MGHHQPLLEPEKDREDSPRTPALPPQPPPYQHSHRLETSWLCEKLSALLSFLMGLENYSTFN